tara:strand:+ start:587 stop:778 length:192 start_codon:yes stop_codon:yes gene_type:complete
MKIGDLVRYADDGPTIAKGIDNLALIIDIDNSHRQEVCTLMMDTGRIVNAVWTAQLEVVNESR